MTLDHKTPPTSTNDMKCGHFWIPRVSIYIHIYIVFVNYKCTCLNLVVYTVFNVSSTSSYIIYILNTVVVYIFSFSTYMYIAIVYMYIYI